MLARTETCRVQIPARIRRNGDGKPIPIRPIEITYHGCEWRSGSKVASEVTSDVKERGLGDVVSPTPKQM